MTNLNKPIIVLGMHRSGTSCLAGSLQESGVYFGDVSLQNQYNKKGNRENQVIMSLNNSILDFSHGSWDAPPENIIWTQKHIEQGLSIINTFEDHCGGNFWGFKDPRTLLTFPFWESLLPEYQLVGTIRSPFDVSKSLNTRDEKFTIDKGLKLWLEYNILLLKIRKKQKFPIISFDLANSEYQSKIKLIQNQLQLPTNLETIFFDKNLRSKKSDAFHIYDITIQNCLSSLEEFLI